MKKTSLSVINRFAIIILILLALVFASLLAAGSVNRQTLLHQQASVTDSINEPTSEIGSLEFVNGQSMSGDNYTLSTDLQTPSAMLLPLKTLQDFPASQSATTATIVTNRGRLIVELYPEQAPLTVANFVSLVREGFYDDLHFHRVEPGFVVQIGDPASKGVTDPEQLKTLGTGYPGYRIEDEFSPTLSHDGPGVLSMANINLNGNYPHSGGSQFFITLAPAPHLDGRHAIFGRVTSGLDVLDKLQVGYVITAVQLE